MIYILLLYVLPFLLSIILVYKFCKKNNMTRKDFLNRSDFIIFPLINLIYPIDFIIEFLSKSKIIKNIKNYLNRKL